jgi:HEAT repeat protein
VLTLISYYDSPNLFFFVGMILIFALGSLIAGPSGAVLVVTLALILVPPVSLALERDTASKKWEDAAVNRAEGLVRGIVEPCLLSPVLLGVIAAMRCLPIRCDRFIRYASSGLLLKRSARDVEFVHRLLRDYFALRDLQPLLNDGSVTRRLRAIGDLGFLGESAIETLADYAASGDSALREAAIRAFGKIAAPQAVTYLSMALADTDLAVRRAAISSFKGRREEDIDRLLSRTSSETEPELIMVLVDVLAVAERWSDTSALLNRLFTSPGYGHDRVRDELMRRVARVICSDKLSPTLDPRKTPRWLYDALLECLKDRNPAIRKKAVTLLGTSERHVQQIVEALAADADPQVRAHAASVLGENGTEKAVDGLIEALSDRRVIVRRAAALALSELGDRGVVRRGDTRVATHLLRVLGGWRAEARVAAADALGVLGDERAVEPLARALRSWRTRVRVPAAEALGQIGGARAMAALKRATRDRSVYVRSTAGYALSLIDNQARDDHQP